MNCQTSTWPTNCILLTLSALISSDGLLWVSRLDHSHVSHSIKHPIILHKCSAVSKLLVLQVHCDAGHAGVGTLPAILSETYHMTVLKFFLKQIIYMICQKTYYLDSRSDNGTTSCGTGQPSSSLHTRQSLLCWILLYKR